MEQPPVYLNTREVADLLGLHPDTVKKMRHRSMGPPCTRVGKQSVRYDRAKVITWVEAQVEAA